MKKKPLILAALVTIAAPMSPCSATLYWDSNDSDSGAGTTPTGTWGTSAFWSSDSLGEAATGGWTAAEAAVFSAGSDASGAWTLSVSGTQSASSVLVEEGIITLGSGTIDTGASTFTIGNGVGSTARINIPTNARVNNGGKIVLDGGTLFSTNTGNAGSILLAAKGLEITANGGTVGYDDGNGANAFTTVYQGTITGVGGTSTAGVGTLTKIGPDEFRVQGAGVENFSFQKLNVVQGLYRVGANSTPTGAAGDNGFGADPAAPLADAVTLSNGGSIGVSLAVTWNPNRGITLGSGGGAINVSGGSLVIPAAITGSGGLTLIRTTGTGALTLSGNNDYTGNTIIPVARIDADSATAFGTDAGNTQVAAGAEVRYDGAENNYTTAEPFQIAGVGAGSGGAIAVQNASHVTFSGPITLSADATVTVSGAATSVYAHANAFTATDFNLTLQGGAGTAPNGIGTISGIISLGSGGVTKLQGGRWVLSAANTYNGATTISAGTLVAASDAALGTTVGGTTVASGAVLGFQGDINYLTAEPVSIGGTGAISNLSGITTFGGPITLTANSSINTASGSLTLTNVIGESAGPWNLTKSGTGTLVLGAMNTYTGTTTVSAGTLAVASNSALGTLDGGTTVSGATLGFQGDVRLRRRGGGKHRREWSRRWRRYR